MPSSLSLRSRRTTEKGGGASGESSTKSSTLSRRSSKSHAGSSKRSSKVPEQQPSQSPPSRDRTSSNPKPAPADDVPPLPESGEDSPAARAVALHESTSPHVMHFKPSTVDAFLIVDPALQPTVEDISSDSEEEGASTNPVTTGYPTVNPGETQDEHSNQALVTQGSTPSPVQEPSRPRIIDPSSPRLPNISRSPEPHISPISDLPVSPQFVSLRHLGPSGSPSLSPSASPQLVSTRGPELHSYSPPYSVLTTSSADYPQAGLVAPTPSSHYPVYPPGGIYPPGNPGPYYYRVPQHPDAYGPMVPNMPPIAGQGPPSIPAGFAPPFPGYAPPARNAANMTMGPHPGRDHSSPMMGVGLPGHISAALVPPETMRPLTNHPASGVSVYKDDQSELLHRVTNTVETMANISAALPDIQQLLTKYRDAQGLLTHREELIRKSEVQQANTLKQKEQHIGSLRKQLDDEARKHSVESNKLRLDIGNLEDQLKDLREELTASESAKDKLLDANASITQEKSNLNSKFKEEKETFRAQLESWKTATLSRFDEEKRFMREQFDHNHQRQEELHTETRSSIMRELESEKALRAERELEISSLKTKLSESSKEIRAVHNEEREAWIREKEILLVAHEAKHAAAVRSLEEQHSEFTRQHEKQLAEMKSSMARESEEGKLRSAEAQERLEQAWDDERAELQKTVVDFQAICVSLGEQNSRLHRMVETFGVITEIKSKGDDFYVDSFQALSRQITELAELHVCKQEITLPQTVLDSIPPEIPSFSSSSNLAQLLRTSYIQHLISRTLCHHIFDPFLFSLGGRFDKADSLFQAMSDELRKKSIRKEAVWRQNTLYAAYTASSAKRAANTAAGTVVEEIVEQIKHFTDPSEIETVSAGVRRIVKMAAETWRYARLEKERITARMVETTDEPEDGASWLHYRADSDKRSTDGDKSPKMLLGLLPLISREASQESQTGKGESADKGCVYTRGVALFSDSKLILDSFQENQSSSTDTQKQTSPGDSDDVSQDTAELEEPQIDTSEWEAKDLPSAPQVDSHAGRDRTHRHGKPRDLRASPTTRQSSRSRARSAKRGSSTGSNRSALEWGAVQDSEGW